APILTIYDRPVQSVLALPLYWPYIRAERIVERRIEGTRDESSWNGNDLNHPSSNLLSIRWSLHDKSRWPHGVQCHTWILIDQSLRDYVSYFAEFVRLYSVCPISSQQQHCLDCHDK